MISIGVPMEARAVKREHQPDDTFKAEIGVIYFGIHPSVLTPGTVSFFKMRVAGQF